MENTALKMEMITKYHLLAYTDKYIVGYAYKGNIYIAYVSGESISQYIKLDKASRGQGYSIRFLPTASQKLALLPQSKLICSTTFFHNMVAESVYNKGEILEKLVTELEANQHWEKDHIPFTEAGDVEINGIPYQVKFERATFTNEKTLLNMLAH